jgi:hypothetical protein
MSAQQAREPETGEEDEYVTDAAGNKRRRAFRRKLPFGRGAVLVVGNRSHIVGLADLSITGAFLSTRAPLRVGETHVLRLLLLPETVPVEFEAEIVRIAQAELESRDHPRGVAVRFRDLSEKATALLKSFIARGQQPK